MGWWEEKLKKETLTLGDEPLDRVVHALEEICRLYEEEVGRKPTLEEFRQTLLRPLAVDPSRYFSDLETQTIGDVVFRLRKIPKRQAFAVGDYFAIPLDGDYYYGRILQHWACDHLVEVYGLKTKSLLTLPQLLARNRKVVMNKNIASRDAFTRGRWKILGHEDIPKDFEFPCFYGGGPLAYSNYILWQGDKEYRVPMEQARKYEPAIWFSPERIEDALRTGRFTRWPEVEESKKETFGRSHKAGLRMLERMGIPTEPE